MITTVQAALATRHDSRKNRDDGFTLIELLVVVLIIGILAAIAIPIFLGQQSQAKDSGAKSDVANSKIAEVSYAVDNDGAFASAGADLENYGYSQTPGAHLVSITLDSVDATKFCVSVKSATGTWYAATDNSGVEQGYCGLYAAFVAGQPG